MKGDIVRIQKNVIDNVIRKFCKEFDISMIELIKFNIKSFGYLLMTREINVNDLVDEVLQKAKTDPDDLTGSVAICIQLMCEIEKAIRVETEI